MLNERLNKLHVSVVASLHLSSKVYFPLLKMKVKDNLPYCESDTSVCLMVFKSLNNPASVLNSKLVLLRENHISLMTDTP